MLHSNGPVEPWELPMSRRHESSKWEKEYMTFKHGAGKRRRKAVLVDSYYILNARVTKMGVDAVLLLADESQVVRYAVRPEAMGVVRQNLLKDNENILL